MVCWNATYSGESITNPVRSLVIGRKSAWTSPRILAAALPQVSAPNRSRLIVTCFTLISMPRASMEAAEAGRMTISPLTGPNPVPSRKGIECPERLCGRIGTPFRVTAKLGAFNGTPSISLRSTSGGSNRLVRPRRVTVVPLPLSEFGARISKGSFHSLPIPDHSSLSNTTRAAKSPF